ncbi:unnamed protein product [Phytophthora lilii]|uniref:Unnamed protein product n=1 Tax=Phytophthora lilii TaxID=2077276 RepID=A0A9W6YJM5_9STRA|nr:unnamed protein product [Phytophthora lilii]
MVDIGHWCATLQDDVHHTVPMYTTLNNDVHHMMWSRTDRMRRQQQQQLQTPRRHPPSTSGPLSPRARVFHGDKAVATPRRQVQRLRDGSEKHSDADKKHAKIEIKSRHLQPEHGDEHSATKHADGEELLMMMEGCNVEGASVIEGTLEQRQNQDQGCTKASEARVAGTVGVSSKTDSTVSFSSTSRARPRSVLKVPVLVENQADIGTLPVTPQMTSRSRRPSLLRAAQSSLAEIEISDGGNNASSEWSTAPAPFVSFHPDHLVGHTSSVCALVVHDDSFIVSCSVDGSVKVWSQVTFECLHTIYGHRDVVSSVALNLKWLVSGSHDCTLRVYDCASGGFNLLCVLTGHSGHVTQVRMPPMLASFIVSCSDDSTLRLWSAELGQCIYTLQAHHSRVTCFDVQSDRICSGAADGSVCFWDISSLALPPEHSVDQRLSCARIYYAHKTTVQCIVDMSSSKAASSLSGGRAYSELCSVVVTGSNDGTIQLFSAKNLTHLGRLDNVGSPVYAAAALSNGRLLCSTKDGRLLMYGNLFRPTSSLALGGSAKML